MLLDCSALLLNEPKSFLLKYQGEKRGSFLYSSILPVPKMCNHSPFFPSFLSQATQTIGKQASQEGTRSDVLTVTAFAKEGSLKRAKRMKLSSY